MELPQELVLRARQGDLEARDALVTAVWPHAYRIALSILRREDLALDAAQEAVARLLVHLQGLRNTEAFPAWFFRLTANASYTLLRQERPGDSRLMHRAEGLVRSSEEPGIRTSDAVVGSGPRRAPQEEDTMAGVDLAVDLKQALADLREPFRTTFLLAFGEGLTSREVGQVLGIPPGTVRYRLTVARRLLVGWLDPVPRQGASDPGDLAARGHKGVGESRMPEPDPAPCANVDMASERGAPHG